YAMLPELVQDAAGTLTGGAPIQQALRKAVVGQPVFAFKLIQQGFDFLGIIGEGSQFATEFVAGMLAPGQIAYGASLERGTGFFGGTGLVAAGRKRFEIVVSGRHGQFSCRTVIKAAPCPE